eukprot:575056-Pelagomonas_calceolata.AAC.2
MGPSNAGSRAGPEEEGEEEMALAWQGELSIASGRPDEFGGCVAPANHHIQKNPMSMLTKPGSQLEGLFLAVMRFDDDFSLARFASAKLPPRACTVMYPGFPFLVALNVFGETLTGLLARESFLIAHDLLAGVDFLE